MVRWWELSVTNMGTRLPVGIENRNFAGSIADLALATAYERKQARRHCGVAVLKLE